MTNPTGEGTRLENEQSSEALEVRIRLTAKNMTDNNWISPYSGAQINLEQPKPEQINLEDVALGLSNTNRYGGQTIPSLNVASHSLNVAEILNQQNKAVVTELYGLLHDTAEAYLGDVPRPAKEKIEGFEELEENILNSTYKKFGLPKPTEKQWQQVMKADDMNLITEIDRLYNDEQKAEEITSSVAQQFTEDVETIKNDLENLPLDTPNEEARQNYITEFEELMEKV